MEIGQASTSALKIHDIVVNKIEFRRKEQEIDFNKELNFKFDNEILESQEQSIYKVKIDAALDNGDDWDFNLQVTMCGYFSFEDDGNIDENTRDILIQKNTLAILYPYLRSLITTISSNVNIKPIILPALNINALVEQQNRNSEE